LADFTGVVVLDRAGVITQHLLDPATTGPSWQALLGIGGPIVR
jgi:hypothetical protein